jgi:hypothetical protein
MKLKLVRSDKGDTDRNKKVKASKIIRDIFNKKYQASGSEVKNTWSYTSTPPICLHGVVFN